ncbi:hypothetical protein TraAM80_09424 [Trypanosoma rangeli]|uniref:Uncharacterized protein n=1 Tax=Trypanosoma rangeli TaxID=5698 RepID=A0A422MVI0_TRYRA|nr:uncharacterized protein TraAM80_09424 [Trypanosoma rangeli]RNE97245.1 hypothetical protein TraAM80_09424 [Trypanosoma rangeli]|eukprot:RNE97245.1 hypothetical protein TraAM80_09424 [Trypanosoma rangeli]
MFFVAAENGPNATMFVFGCIAVKAAEENLTLGPTTTTTTQKKEKADPAVLALHRGGGRCAALSTSSCTVLLVSMRNMNLIWTRDWLVEYEPFGAHFIAEKEENENLCPCRFFCPSFFIFSS